MKKILLSTLIVLCAFCSVKAQYVVPRGLPLKNTFYTEHAAPAGGDLYDSLVMWRSSDTAMKPLYPAIKFFSDNTPYYWDMTGWRKFASSSAVGTVTSVATNDATGITGGTITSTGTLAIDTFHITTRDWLYKVVDSLPTGTGTVTSVATNNGTGLIGGTITTSGTLYIDTFNIATRGRLYKAIDSLSLTVGSGTVTSVGLSMPSAFTVTNSPVTTSGTLTVTGAGTTAQYIRGDGSLATFPTITSGTVTSVATNDGTGIHGGTITTSGTLYLDTFLLSTRPWLYKVADSLAAKYDRAYTTITQINDSTFTINRFDGTKDTIQFTSGSGGTVTSFSAGNLSPLFTTSVANPTTTPALSFTLSNAAGGTVFGNNTSSSAAPAYTTNPVLGINGTSTGILGLAYSGASGQTISVQNGGATSAYNFNLPTTAGTSGYLLTSAGGGSSAMTWTDPTTLGNTYWSRTTLSGSSLTTNILQPTTIADTVVMGGTGVSNRTGKPLYQVNAVGAIGAFRYGLLTTSTDGMVLENDSAATTTNRVEISPRLRFHSAAWITGSGGQSRTSDWKIEDIPVTGTNSIGSNLTFGWSNSGGAYVNIFNLGESQTIGVGNNNTATSTTAINMSGGLPIAVVKGIDYQQQDGGTGAGSPAVFGAQFLITANTSTSYNTSSEHIALIGKYSHPEAVLSASAGLYEGVRGALVFGNGIGTGAVTKAVGVESQFTIGGANARQVTTLYGMWVNPISSGANTGGGRITNYSAIRVDSILADMTWGKPFAIDVRGTNSYSFVATSGMLVGNYIGAGSDTATSTFFDNGSFATAYITKAIDYTATINDATIEVTATGKTITLPDATTCTGRIYRIKLTASGSGTVATTSSQNIDASTTYSLSAQYKYVTVQSNGTGWIIVGNN